MSTSAIPFFGARKLARQLQEQVTDLTAQLERTDAFAVGELERLKVRLEQDVAGLRAQLAEAQTLIVCTDETASLQEVGVYEYRHPLSVAAAYRDRLEAIQRQIKEMNRADAGAILASADWKVNGSLVEGRKMVRQFSKLMLRAFNAEADTLVRGLKPYALDKAVERLHKTAHTIQQLGQTMQISVAPAYLKVRFFELTLTADFLQKKAEEKEVERVERERLREERKVQLEIEREQAKLAKEREHYERALAALSAIGGADEAIARLKSQLDDVDKAIADMNYRAANIRAGYVYVISNVGSFGDNIVKIGLTRRLDPRDRIRELSDASVPFNFDVHALFFSKDAVGIETALHNQFSAQRMNLVNRRREFFRATAAQVRGALVSLAGDLLEFEDIAEALEYRQSEHVRTGTTTAN
ncbi:MAG: DUF4041 domain-containing protein [Vicinamibacterales bacterium]